jgi:hypothetical protein
MTNDNEQSELSHTNGDYGINEILAEEKTANNFVRTNTEDEKLEIIENDPMEQKAERQNKKVSNWVGTWNNPTMTDDEFYLFLLGLEQDGFLQYAIFQREKGKESRIEHFQFYINFKNARAFNWVKKTLPYGCHFKPMYSTPQYCKSYCSKPETRIGEVYEVGEFISQGKRSDLEKIIELMRQAVPLSTIQTIYPTQCVMYARQLEKFEQDLLNQKQECNFRNLTVNYIYGKTGTGKTKFVLDKHGYKNVWRIKFYDQRAFDKYHAHSVLVFDEYRSQFKVADMLNYLDGYPLELPCRYYDKQACYTTVYIISNIPLEQQYPNVQKDEVATWQAFLRRINNVYNFDDEKQRQKLMNGEPNKNHLYIDETDPKQIDLVPIELTEQDKQNMPW